MNDQIIQLAKMLAILYPEYAQHFDALQEECAHFRHLVAGDSLSNAIINLCQSPLILQNCSARLRIEIENLLLIHSQPDIIH